jgi:multicomponent Na+:H+ antiporter subunit A
VNVILVDFRALDTLGEITVLAVAALGAFVLVRFGEKHLAPRSVAAPSLVLQTATRYLITLLLLAALFSLWRGHNEPGGGFIGGLVAAGAFALYLIAFGEAALSRMLRVHPRALLGVGLAVSLLSGLIAYLAGKPFMTGNWLSLVLGEEAPPLKLGTPLLFDVGVFLVVIGFALTIILALERARSRTA